MRGIDRVLAVILLAGAVGGAAAFARHSGSDSAARVVHLAVPPLQHVEAPETVLIAPPPAPTRVKPATVAPIARATIVQAALRRPLQAVQPQTRVQPPEPKPAPAPVEEAPSPVQAPPAPVQTPEPPRALAVVQPTASLPVVPPPTVDSSGDEHGNGNDEQGNNNGDDHGQGSGQDQGGGPKHSGD